MKKVWMYVIVFAIVCSFCEYGLKMSQANQIASRSPISLSFASIGAISLESRLDTWAKIDSALSFQEMNRTILTILDNLNLPVDDIQIQEDMTHISFDYAKDQVSYHVKVECGIPAGTTMVTVTIIGSNPGFDPHSAGLALERVPGWSWHHYYLYTGIVEQRISADGQRQILSVMMENLGAEIFENFADGKVASCTGYSPGISPRYAGVYVGANRINVQGAIRTRYDQKSMVYVGMPLILGEY